MTRRRLRNTKQAISRWRSNRRQFASHVLRDALPMPTLLPTSLPSPLPSSSPTGLPTQVPTPAPSVLPVPMPSFVPVPEPTPMPTNAGCVNDVLDYNETDIDCGGGECRRCELGQTCEEHDDCQTFACVGSICVPTPSAVPTPAPTPSPTPLPSQEPTPIPSPLPSPLPPPPPEPGAIAIAHIPTELDAH